MLSTGKAHTLQHVADPALDFVGGNAALLQAIGHVLAHVHHREQGQVLKDHVDRSAVGSDAVHRPATDHDIATIGRAESGNHAQQSGFATAAGAQYREEAAALHGEGQIAHRFKGAKAFGNAGHLQIRLLGGRFDRTGRWHGVVSLKSITGRHRATR